MGDDDRLTQPDHSTNQSPRQDVPHSSAWRRAQMGGRRADGQGDPPSGLRSPRRSGGGPVPPRWTTVCPLDVELGQLAEHWWRRGFPGFTTSPTASPNRAGGPDAGVLHGRVRPRTICLHGQASIGAQFVPHQDNVRRRPGNRDRAPIRLVAAAGTGRIAAPTLGGPAGCRSLRLPEGR